MIYSVYSMSCLQLTTIHCGKKKKIGQIAAHNNQTRYHSWWSFVPCTSHPVLLCGETKTYQWCLKVDYLYSQHIGFLLCPYHLETIFVNSTDVLWRNQNLPVMVEVGLFNPPFTMKSNSCIGYKHVFQCIYFSVKGVKAFILNILTFLSIPIVKTKIFLLRIDWVLFCLSHF